MHHLQFEIEVAAPFRLDLTVWTLRRRPHNAIDEWDGSLWRRTVWLGGQSLGLTVCQQGTAADPRLIVTAGEVGRPLGDRDVTELRRVVALVLGLGVDLGGFYAVAATDRRLSSMAERFRGMRPPLFSSIFEALVNAVACQQISLDVGIHLLNRLARRSAPGNSAGEGPTPFPTAAQLASADLGSLVALGFSRSKATTLLGIAGAVARTQLELEDLERLDNERAAESLMALRGVGPWSADYTLLRGLGRLDVLPRGDVGAQNALRRRFGLPAGADRETTQALTERWRPYGGVVYFHLLLDRLAEQGHVHVEPG